MRQVRSFIQDRFSLIVEVGELGHEVPQNVHSCLTNSFNRHQRQKASF